MRFSLKTALAFPIVTLLIGMNSAMAFSFGSDDDDDWWRYSYYGNPNQPWVTPSGMMYYPRMPYFERNRMVDSRQWQMESKRRAMQEIGDMIYGQGGFDRTRAIQLARTIEATAGQALGKDFHPGSVASHRSRTTFSLWRHRDVFDANAAALKAAANDLAQELAKQPTVEEGAVMLKQRPDDPYAQPTGKQVAVSGDVWAKYNEVSNICDHCHRDYRGPERW